MFTFNFVNSTQLRCLLSKFTWANLWGAMLQLDLTLHCLLYPTTESYLGLGIISFYVVSANHLLTLIELFSFSTPLISLYKFVQNLASFRVSRFALINSW